MQIPSSPQGLQSEIIHRLCPLELFYTHGRFQTTLQSEILGLKVTHAQAPGHNPQRTSCLEGEVMKISRLSIVAHARNPGTVQAEAEGS